MQNDQFLNRVEYLPVSALRPSPHNARVHPPGQARMLAKSIKKFGFVMPLLTDEKLNVLAGHGRLDVAKQLRMATVPVLRVSHLTEEERAAYMIADNRLAEHAHWDNDLLSSAFVRLGETGFDLTLTGFDLSEIDMIVSDVEESRPDVPDKFDDVPEAASEPITREGDLWYLGRHALYCGNTRDPSSFDRLMWGQQADVLFTDAPYNLATKSISGNGRTQHRDFVEASGEMSPAEFVRFLQVTLGNAAYCCRDGAIAYTFMDWRHMGEMLQAGTRVFGPLKQLCVWGKTAAGMGTFYRSQHELVFVWKVGADANVNNFKLGQNGRHRSNLWTYAGVNTFRAERMDQLQLHPTVKPVALISDALKDVTNRGDIVLDCFGGSGSTLIASEKTGRAARLIEIDPQYCDATIRRFQKLTGKSAKLSVGQMTFDEIALQRQTPKPLVEA